MLPWGVKFLRNGSEQKVRSTSDAMEVLCAPSIDLYKRHLAGTGNEDLVVDAMYVHAFRDGSKATLKSLDYKIRQEKGADLELIGQDELRRTEPAIAPDFEAAVLIKGQARARSPGDICSVLFEKARSLGVTFLRGAIRGIQPTERGWEVSTETGEFRSPNLVLALGAWSAPFLKDLGLTPPLMAERGYHVEFRDPGVTLQNSVMDVDAKCVASSMTTGLRFAGQAEFGPVDAPPDHRKQALLTGLAKAAFPDLQTGEQSFWMGRRPSMHDSLPVMGPVERQTGLYLNFGHSHYGLMMAPKSGEILADIITGNRSNQDMSAYALSRFA